MHAKNAFGRAEKSVFLPMHVPQCMAKRVKLKKVEKNKNCAESGPETQCRTALGLNI